MAIDVTFLVKAYNAGQASFAAIQAGKKGTALDHAGQAVSYIGKFTAEALDENAVAPGVLASYSALSDEQLLAEIDKQIGDAKLPGTLAINPALLFLLKILVSRLLKRLLPDGEVSQ